MVTTSRPPQQRTTTLDVLTSNAALETWIDSRLDEIPASLARTVTLVIPSHRIAHRTRRRACLAGLPARVAGVRMVRVEDLARDVLARGGVATEPSLAELRLPGLRNLVLSDALENVDLRYFDRQALANGRGYSQAITTTITDLEEAGLNPSDLNAMAAQWEADATPDADLSARRARDLAGLWQVVDDGLRSDDSALRSTSEILLQAAQALVAEDSLATVYGHVLVVLSLSPSTAMLDFLVALKPRAVALPVGRPARAAGQRVIDAAAKAFGDPQHESPAELPREHWEVHLIQRYLFASPEELADPTRPRSPGSDGTVTLEQHLAIQHEIGAAVGWVIEEIVERRTPLEEIALIVPTRDPIAGMLVTALERRDKGGNADCPGAREASDSPAIPAFVANGLPVTDHVSGTLLNSLLGALHAHLPAERVIPILPRLRLEGSADLRLSEAEAAAITYGSGVVGGTPERAAEWAEKLGRRARTLSAQIARMDADDDAQREDDPEKVRWALGRKDALRTHEIITALLPSVQALTSLAASVTAGASIETLWSQIEDFLKTWCRTQPGPPDARTLLTDAVAAVCGKNVGDRLHGREAIDYLATTLTSLRAPHGRFGEPRVFIGTADDALGLTFRAIRIMGVVEGAVPPSPHEDPILTDAAREQLETFVRRDGDRNCRLERSGDRILQATHSIFLTATAASNRLALTAPRRWIDGTDRELSGLMLEAAVALGRPDPISGSVAIIPPAPAFRSLYVDPGSRARRSTDLARPAITRLVLDAVAEAASTGAIPPAWVAPTVPDTFSATRMHSLLGDRESTTATVSDGVLGPLGERLRVAGLDSAKTISASGLRTLLECPHRYLLERILYLEGPAEPPPMHEIGQPDYGSLVHRVVQEFFTIHGPAFCRRESTLDSWLRAADEIASGALMQFIDGYPLASAGSVEDQGARLRRDVRHLLRDEWVGHSGLSFIGVERPFGYNAPVTITLPGRGSLHVAGFIDRLDSKDGRLIVRDVKTGRPKPIEDYPVDVALDTQIALYALVADQAVSTPGMPVAQVAYVYPTAAGDSARIFEGAALDELLTQARGWFGIAADLLAARSFPRTTDGERCTYCDFRVVCGDRAPEISQRKLESVPPTDPMAAFLRLQQPDVD